MAVAFTDLKEQEMIEINGGIGISKVAAIMSITESVSRATTGKSASKHLYNAATSNRIEPINVRNSRLRSASGI